MNITYLPVPHAVPKEGTYVPKNNPNKQTKTIDSVLGPEPAVVAYTCNLCEVGG